jgi:hypothetical protein
LLLLQKTSRPRVRLRIELFDERLTLLFQSGNGRIVVRRPGENQMAAQPPDVDEEDRHLIVAILIVRYMVACKRSSLVHGC